MKNIIYLNSHDTGRCIQPYGFAAETPHLMALARSGTVFRQAYAAAPNCSPSRAALLTGRMPHNNGMVGLSHLGTRIQDYSQHLSQFLKKSGYETVCCGFQHEAPPEEKESLLGYEQYLQSPARDKLSTPQVRDERTARAAADYLRAKDSEQPFFLTVAFHSTHRPLPEEHPGINPDYLKPPSPLHDNPVNREDTARYHASVQTLDRCIGQVLEAIREAGLEEETLILYTTDHGLAFPHMKSTLYDDGIGVSLILQYAGNPLAGKATDALVSQLDIFPTLCDLAGLEKPAWLEGISLKPLLHGETDSIRDHLFAELNYHSSYEPQRCIRTERYKLIQRWPQDLDDVIPNHTDKSPSRDFLYENGWLNTVPEPEALYDLYFDPNERTNRIEDPPYQEIARELKEKLQAWMEATNDPLLQGRVPTPNGYRLYENQP